MHAYMRAHVHVCLSTRTGAETDEGRREDRGTRSPHVIRQEVVTILTSAGNAASHQAPWGAG